MKRSIAALAASTLLAFPFAASAQMAPPPKPPASDETIHGTVDSLADHYTLLLRDDRGFIDTVTLRDETVVNPSELNLTPGLTVTIVGHASGKTFVADEVDAPNAPPSAQGAPQNAPDDGPGMQDGAPPYQAQADMAPQGPAYESDAVDPGYGAPDLVYGSPYYGPAYGIAIGGYYGGCGYYCGGGFYGGYYGRPYYGGGYYPGGYYNGGYYNGGYHSNPTGGGYGSPPHTTLPIRRAPGTAYPIYNSRAPYAPGSNYRAAPQSTYQYHASASRAQSSTHSSSTPSYAHH